MKHWYVTGPGEPTLFDEPNLAQAGAEVPVRGTRTALSPGSYVHPGAACLEVGRLVPDVSTSGDAAPGGYPAPPALRTATRAVNQSENRGNRTGTHQPASSPGRTGADSMAGGVAEGVGAGTEPALLGAQLRGEAFASLSKFRDRRLPIIGRGSDPDELAEPMPRSATRPRNFAYTLEQAARGRLPLGKLVTDVAAAGEIGAVFDWAA